MVVDDDTLSLATQQYMVHLITLTSTDENERQELYKSVLTNLHEDAMYLPLTYECNKALYTSALHGVHFGTDQYDVPFADMYFE